MDTLHQPCLRLIALGAVLLALVPALGGCSDTSFDPFVESNFTYSIFGYLDASADTQFIRISPVRDSIALAPVPFDATVSLEYLETGQTTTWGDSLFVFRDNIFERVAYNYWSSEPLIPNTAYRLTVTRSDGATSQATVALPDTFPTPRLDNGAVPFTSPLTWRQSIVVSGVERLAALLIDYTFYLPGTPPDNTGHQTLSYLARVRPMANGLAAVFDAYEDLRDVLPGNTCPIVVEATVRLAAAGPGWPNFEEIDPETLARPDIITNIENGVGFVGGIASQTLPWPGVVGVLNTRQNLCVQRMGR